MGSSNSSPKRDIEIGEQVPSSADVYRIWTEIYPCVERKRLKRTLFIKNFSETDSKETRSFYENGIKKLRQLRHPSIVKYVDSCVDTNEVSIITERVEMLDLVIDSQSPIEIHAGLIDIHSALIFLHHKAFLSHNNICPSSIFVLSDGRWKLGGFECSQDVNNTQHWVQTDFVRSIKNSEFVPPEDELMLKNNTPSTARDAFAFGKLINYSLPYLEHNLSEDTISSLTEVAQSLTNQDVTKRAQLSSVPESYPSAFSNHLTTIVHFIQAIHQKTPQEKSHFFEDVVDWLKEIPEVIIGKRLVSTLLSRYVLLEQCAHSILYPVLLRPSDMENSEKRNGLLSFDGFRKWVVPEVLRIFPVHDKSVRIALLNHFPLYINYFTQSQLTNVILPELRLGMCDSDDDLVSASLHSMAHLVPILGGSAVTGLPHKKSFADGTPKKEGLYCRENVLRSHVSSPLIVLTPTIDTKKDDNSYSLSPSNNLSRLLSEDDDYYDAHERNNIKLRLISTNDDEICASSLSTSELQSNEQINDVVQSEWSTNWGSDGNEDDNDTEYDSPASLSSPMSPSEPISASQHRDASNLQPCPHIVKQSTPTDMRNETDEAEKSKDENCTADDDIDYFADMEPIIKKTPSLNEYLTKQPHESIASNFTNRFSILPADDPSTTPDANANNYGAWETTIDDWDAD